MANDPVYFWRETEVPHGPLSQWYPCEFKHEGTTYNSTEQWMMSQKAAVFGDLDIAKQIADFMQHKCSIPDFNRAAETNDPAEQKSLGRKVKNFDGKKWDQHKYRIVEEGNYLKFTQSASTHAETAGQPLRQMLMETGERDLVEASPYDRIWGIGFTAKDAATSARKDWGENLLGKALMAVRKRLREEESKA